MILHHKAGLAELRVVFLYVANFGRRVMNDGKVQSLGNYHLKNYEEASRSSLFKHPRGVINVYFLAVKTVSKRHELLW